MAELDLKAQIASIRKTEHNFAVVIGKEGLDFQADKRRATDALWRTAKEGAGGTKGTKGVIRFEDSMLILKCEDEPPAQLKKLLRKHLKDNGVKLKFAFELPDGAVDGDDADVDAQDDRKPKLVKAFALIKPDLANVLRVANPEDTAALQTLVKAFGEDMKQNQIDRSEQILRTLRARVGEITTRRAEGNRRRQAELATMRAQADAVLGRLRRMRDDSTREANDVASG
ncbi:MAG: hypothetical protein AAGA87_05250 [Pseudomonadota bacterium]